MKLKVRLYGDSVLRTQCKKVGVVGVAERMLIQSMVETMNKHNGVGLAAPQVGISRRIFVADANDGQGGRAFIDPIIMNHEGMATMEEGCLSIPQVHIKIDRPFNVCIRFTDENDEKHEDYFTELMARIVQHEMDHLDGKLIIDYASKQEMQKYHDQLEQLKGDSQKRKGSL